MFFDFFNLKFIIFSKDFKNFEFSESIYLRNYFVINNLINFYYIPLTTFRNTNKIYKIDKNKIAIFNSYRLYVFKINNDLLFRNCQ